MFHRQRRRSTPPRTVPVNDGKAIDFTRKWEMADVAIKTENTGQLLHVNKSVLAVHSPFFKALFFSDFAESMQDVVEVGISYWAMLEILKIVHHVDRNFGLTGHKLYAAEKLAVLYRAGDEFDIPLIRELCKQQFTQISPKEAFEVAIQLELHEQKSEILRRMEFEDIEAYLKREIKELVLSPADAAVIVEKHPEVPGGLLDTVTLQCLAQSPRMDKKSQHRSLRFPKRRR